MEVTAKVAFQPTGNWPEEPLPPMVEPGEVVDLPDDEAKHFVNLGAALLGDVTPEPEEEEA